jgi:hypothetical protein
VNAVLGGWAAGYAMAILSTFAFTYLALQPGLQKFVQRWIDPQVPGFLLAVPISIGTTVLWTMAGLMLASAYVLGGFEDKPGALGAPSWQFALITLVLAFLPVPILFALSRRLWWLWFSMSLAFAGLFGWLMPVLAER